MSDPNFNNPTINPFGFAPTSAYSKPTLVDIDGDGDLDAFVGGQYSGTLLYRNNGTATAPLFAAPVRSGIDNDGNFNSPTFADIDGDGDLDAFIGILNGNIWFSRNNGTANAPIFGNSEQKPFGLFSVGEGSTPTFADIDGDGDLDAFRGTQNGDIWFSRNNGTATNPSFNSANNFPFGLTNVGASSSPTFADIDGDGDLDAVVGGEDGNTRFYRNIGTTSSPAFANPTINPFGLTDVGFNSSPTLADIDGDGDLDAFIGTQNGEILFYRNNVVAITQSGGKTAVTEGGATDTYTVKLDHRPTANVTITIKTGRQLSTSTTTLIFTSANWNTAQTVTVAAVNDTVGEGKHTGVIKFTATSTDPSFNGAKISTIVATITDNDLPVGNPSFAAPVTTLLADIGNKSKPTFADIDEDGDLDAFVGGEDGITRFFRNVGTATAPSFGTAVTNLLTDVGNNSSPTFADIDRDGDLDAFVGALDGNTRFYRNNGTAAAPNFAAPAISPFGLTDVGSWSSPTFADIDGDGDLDAFVGANGSSLAPENNNTFFYRNEGTANDPIFAAPQANPFGLNSIIDNGGNGGYASSPTFADIDGDGDFDAFIGENYGHTLFYRNVGTANSPSFVAATPNLFGLTDVGGFSSPTFADIDGDGDLDAFVGSDDGTTLFYRNTAGAPKININISANQTVVEGFTSPQNVSYTVSLSRASTSTVTVQYATANGSAIAGSDYTTKTGTLTFTPGVTSRVITIPILNNSLNEANETFTVRLSSPTNGVLGTSTVATTTIADTLTTAVTTILPANVENLTLTGAGNINGTGNALNNVIIGNTGNNILRGGAGNDTLTGGNGNDTYIIDADIDTGVDTINETTTGGIDTLDFGTTTTKIINVDLSKTTTQTAATGVQLVIPVVSIENLYGGTLNDILTGNKLNNMLKGGAGNDTLKGGAGADTLTGGTGNDSFLFNGGAALTGANTVATLLGRDIISDFIKNQDKIVLSKGTFTKITSIAGNFATIANDNAALTTTSSAAILYSTSTGNLFYNQNGALAGLGTNGGNFAAVGGIPALAASDFTIVA